MIPTGTRIRFVKTLDAPANEDHPYIVYAYAGEEGVVTGHGCPEGYWVRTLTWSAPFGASEKEFEVLSP